ncbi:MAG: nucleotide pyrophosphohydrolase [Phycisphaerae bacterium]|nr:nucleotide pyrophosphohydrolase [Phycisphaerae bacterium]
MNTEPTDSAVTVAELRRLVADFIRERDWEQFHDPKNLSMAIATEAAELMEHFRWAQNEASREMMRDPEARHAAAEELADILAFTLSFANAADIDLSSALHAKMLKNAKKYPADEYQGKY